jgi:hypothetical protein
MPQNSLSHSPRMVAWAAQYGLVKSKADVCLRTVLGKRCLALNPGAHSGRDVPHRYFDDRGCGASQRQDHAAIWHITGTKPTIYVYSFHEYNIPAPEVSTSETDDRGLKHTAHRLSWYSPRTSMHVVTVPQDESFAYAGNLPRDAQEYTEMYQRVMGQVTIISDAMWDAFLEEHHSQYAA